MVALSPLSGQNRFEPPLEPVGSGRRAVVAHGELARSAGPPRIVEDQPGQLPDADVGHRVSAFPQHTRAVGSHHDRRQACEEPGPAYAASIPRASPARAATRITFLTCAMPVTILVISN